MTVPNYPQVRMAQRPWADYGDEDPTSSRYADSASSWRHAMLSLTTHMATHGEAYLAWVLGGAPCPAFRYTVHEATEAP